MNKKKITIIDIGSGNILSIKRAFENCGAEVYVTRERDKILSSHKLVLPGVGAFRNAVNELNSFNFFEIISDKKFKQIPMLGICLGMQLLFDESEEFGKQNGLGLIKGKVKKLPNISTNAETLKIPSIGWYQLILSKNLKVHENAKFLNSFDEKSMFYFVHSYYAEIAEKSAVLASYNFGGHLIPSIVAKDNIVGCQFHPEKSGSFGLKLIKNFISLT